MSNPLADVIPARYRKYAYAVAFVASVIVASYEAADGDWRRAIVPIVTALTSALSVSNVR